MKTCGLGELGGGRTKIYLALAANATNIWTIASVSRIRRMDMVTSGEE
jgi:hypothetical protein